MRFIIYGAGGIGASIGARLHLDGQDVVLIARGEHFNSLRSKGLRFVSPRHDKVLHIPSICHPSDLESDARDIVFLCMKGQHTDEALVDLQKVVPDTTPIVCCQNGVANERAALRRFENVYAMCVLVPAEHLEPGVAINFAEETAGALDVGRYPVGLDLTAEDIAAALRNAGFSSVADSSVMRHKHAKLLGNLSNAVQAACGTGSRNIASILRSEALACYAAAGIECASADESRERRSEINGAPVEGFARHGGSSLQSIMRNTGNIEVDFLNGEIVQLGRLYGIPTPANRIVQSIGHQVALSGRAGKYCTIEELEEMVAREC